MRFLQKKGRENPGLFTKRAGDYLRPPPLVLFPLLLPPLLLPLPLWFCRFCCC